MTAYVNAETPRGPLDRKKAEAWLRDLDDDSFATREAARQGLEKLGIAAKPLLRDALKGRPPLEVRRRIEELLARFKGHDAADLEIPPGVTIVTAGEVLEGHLKGVSGGDDAMAFFGLVEFASYSDKAVPALTVQLAKGKSEHVRRLAAHCLGNIGAGARSALPALKVGLADPDPSVRSACRVAIEQIEKAREEAGWAAEVKKRRAILKDLDEWKKARGK
jgi:HEAT repeat protein